MTLLAPTAALLALSLSLPVLGVLYFLRLRRRALRVGSIMLWQQAAKDLEVNVPWRRLRLSVPLVLQLLALAALVLAIGRPVLREGGEPVSRVVLLIDRSASMSAIDTPGEVAPGQRAPSRLEQAKARARSVAQAARQVSGEGGRAKVAVVGFARSAQTMANWTQDSATIGEAIDAIVPSDEPGHLRAALEWLATLQAQQAPGESDTGETGGAAGGDGPVVAYVISDGGFAPGALPAVPPGIDVRFLRIGPAPLGVGVNLGLVAVGARRDYEDPALVRVTARVLSTSREALSVPVRALLQGPDGLARQVATGTARVPAATEGADTLTPGEGVVNLSFAERAGGVLTVALPSGDALASDDAAHVVLDGEGLARVLLVGPEVDGVPAVHGALRTFQREGTGPPHEVVGLATLIERARRADGLDGVDLVIFDGVSPPAGALPSVPTVSFGATLPVPGVALIRAKGEREERALSWKRQHPLLRDVDLSGAEFRAPGALDVPPSATVLAEGVSGPLIVELAPSGGSVVRRVLVAPALSRSTWVADVSLVIFLSNAVDRLTLRGQARAGRWFTTDEPASVRVRAGVGLIEVAGPAGVVSAGARTITVPGATSPEGGEREVSLGVLERAGVYQARGATTASVAVNVFSDTESSIATRATLSLGSASRPVVASQDARLPRELWPWLVLAAAALLTIEWLLVAAWLRA